MKRLITLLALSLGVLFTVLLPIQTASAGAYGGHHGGGYGHSNHHYGNHYYSQPSYSQGYGHSGNYATYPAHNYSHQARPCQQVSKYTYDEYGNAHKIAGTMCYDNYGQGYVVDGSRYEVR
jgi:hypothetical protein